ncbi:MAG: hypothetical protein ACOCZV_00600 [Nanoarchaeota archaeon]
MKIDGNEFDTIDGTEQDLFSYMDTLPKQILSTKVNEDGIPEYDDSKYCLLIVHDHAILLPKEAKEKFESQGWIEYL